MSAAAGYRGGDQVLPAGGRGGEGEQRPGRHRGGGEVAGGQQQVDYCLLHSTRLRNYPPLVSSLFTIFE